MLVIGLSGKIGVGKSSIADALESRLGCVGRAAFGDALKWEAADLYGFDPELCFSQEGKEEVVFSDLLVSGSTTVRQILQCHGRRRREEDADYWVRELGSTLAAMADQGFVVAVVDDVRFPNEAGMLRELDAFLVRVEPYAMWQPGAWKDDVSETALDNAFGWDLVVCPESGPEGIQRAAEEIVAAVGKGCWEGLL